MAQYNEQITISDLARYINLQDVEDMLISDFERSYGNTGVLARETGYETDERITEGYDGYKRPGMLLDTQDVRPYLIKAFDESCRLMGQGSPRNLLQNFLSRMDHHGTALVPLNSMNSGFTFITRPRLNMTSANLRSHPVMTTLEANDPNSVAFMMRMLLDTRMSRGKPIYKGPRGGILTDFETDEMHQAVLKSGLIDPRNPFMVPLCNGLKGLSGFPDFTVQEETTESDFHSGDFTYARGSDMNNRTQELSLEFRDVEGSIIMSIIYYWLMAIALQAKGLMYAYPDDIYAQRLNYTVSIYRFITDQSRQRILWWGKATGCFPKSVPIGSIFNVQQGENTISSAMNFSIPFVANDIKVQDPGILTDFNRLMRRYTNVSMQYQDGIESDAWISLAPGDPTNFNSLPYIVDDDHSLRLIWRTTEEYFDAWGTSAGSADGQDLDWDELLNNIEQKREANANTIASMMFG